MRTCGFLYYFLLSLVYLSSYARLWRFYTSRLYFCEYLRLLLLLSICCLLRIFCGFSNAQIWNLVTVRDMEINIYEDLDATPVSEAPSSPFDELNFPVDYLLLLPLVKTLDGDPLARCILQVYVLASCIMWVVTCDSVEHTTPFLHPEALLRSPHLDRFLKLS